MWNGRRWSRDAIPVWAGENPSQTIPHESPGNERIVGLADTRDGCSWAGRAAALGEG
jgi:hypothetical protein